MNNDQIKDLFAELDNIDSMKDVQSGDLYWEVKMLLFQEITEKYGNKYSPKVSAILNIPAGLVSIVVDMEREILSKQGENKNE